MRRFELAPGVAPLSELVFGAASLGGRVPARQGIAALHAASERGVSGIDLARSYGHGEAERLVGRALIGRRARFVLVTKAGIEPSPPPPMLLRAARHLADPLLARAQGLRRRLVTGLSALGAPAGARGALGVEALMGSLETSLAALRTERVDVFLAHRCPATRGEYEAFAAACERARDAGKLALWGICGTPVELAAVSAHAPAPVVQTPGDVTSRRVADVRGLATALVMYYQPFGGGPGFQRMLAAAPALPPAARARWATEVALRGLLLDAELPTVAVCAMNQPAHVAANTEALSRPSLSEADLRAALTRLRPEPR